MRIVAGVMGSSKGEVLLHDRGEVVKDEDRPLNVGLVAPYLNVYNGFSARENLLFLSGTRRLKNGKSRVDTLLKEVGLGKRGDELVSRYSSGMLQRVRIAAAVLTEPPLLLLDEPTANLERYGIKIGNLMIDAYLNKNRLVIVATKNKEEADRCGERICVEDFL